MSNTNTGGPAFPPSNPGYAQGMTLRDYFAAKAMQMLRSDLNPVWTAEKAYEMADAMLVARSAT